VGDDTVHVCRGRGDDPEADRSVTARALDRAADGVETVRVWTPHRQVAFGRRDAAEPGYHRARRVAAERGYAPVERSVGGRPVAYTGDTLAFARAVPLDAPRQAIDRRYDAAVETLLTTLRGHGAAVEQGEPAGAFCPGDHSVRTTDGGKVAGVAQRVRADAALVAGCLLVDDATAQRTVLAPVYDALDIPFDPNSVSDVASAGGPADAVLLREALEVAFVDGRQRTVVPP
jgi:octanoyl-[GcvH]:protein N-octanoyltransferase